MVEQRNNESRCYLNKLINEPAGMRSDLKGFARIILVLIDYDSGEEENIDRKRSTRKKLQVDCHLSREKI